MLCERILTLRTAHNWTQVQLAEKMSVSKQAVSNWENNNILPSIEMLIRLSKVFSVTTDYLLALDDRSFIEVTGLTDTQKAHLNLIIHDLLENNQRSCAKEDKK
ncbi:MAG: helix-turn-helix transcriptional regulator [Lachnospiraceae bacterium]|nr:helix-turn-helix transcriptional regulator [Lachnospiraceae bacterium]